MLGAHTRAYLSLSSADSDIISPSTFSFPLACFFLTHPIYRNICPIVSSPAIPNLSSIPGVVDIPVPNSHAERGDPICTVNHIGPNRTETLENAWAIVNTIYSQLIPISETP